LRLVTAVVLLALLACASGKKTRCAATVTFEGKPGQGTGDSESGAAESACLDWCAQHDPGVDAALRAYESTPSGKQATGSRFSKAFDAPGGKEALYACKSRCLSGTKPGESQRINCT
jgi:hypothetical protein